MVRQGASGAELLSGFLARFAWFYALASALALVAALVVGASATGAEPQVVARADGDTLVLAGNGSSGLRLYGRVDTGDAQPGPRCRLDSDGPAASVGGRGSPLQLDGEALPRLGGISDGWRDGDRVVCSGAQEVVATQGGGALARLGLAALLVGLSLVSGVLAAVGAARRRARRR